MFSQQRKRQNTSFTSTTSAKPKAEFTVILIEEVGSARKRLGKRNYPFFNFLFQCDLIFAADTNFWPVLKSICAESRVPIVLTCNDYEHVATELNKEPSLLDYKTIHMERPCIKLLSRYLRVCHIWLFKNEFEFILALDLWHQRLLPENAKPAEADRSQAK